MGIGYLVDSFDLINVRDLDVIGQAASGCEQLVVGVLTDQQAVEYFGLAPVVPQEERLAIVRHVRGVASAVLHSASSAQRADIVFVAADRALPGVEPGTTIEPRVRTRSATLAAALPDVPVGEVA